MGDTTIEWTDFTWNPVTGCTKVSQGCKHCYAERVFPRAYAKTGRAFTDVQCHPDRLEQPLRIRAPKRIFVNSMSDLFHEDVPDEFILRVFDVMRQSENGHAVALNRLVPQHTYQVLTKRPARMRDFCKRLRFAQNDGRGLYLAQTLPHNGFNPMNNLHHVWLGVSVEDQATADERIPLLLQTPAAVRFVSYEPALGPVDFVKFFPDHTARAIGAAFGIDPSGPCVDWLIAGGESGPGARAAHPDWFRSARDQCAAAGVAFFFKQWGEWEEVAQDLRDDDGEHHQVRVPSSEADDWFVDGDKRNCLIAPDGTPYYYKDQIPADVKCRLMNRVGKSAAGRLLDGREHSEFPA